MHPILFYFHSVTFYSYGFFVALAVFAVFWIACSRAAAFGLTQGLVADLVFLLFTAGVIGARLFFVLQHWDDYKGNFLKIILIQEGGLVWYGGFIAATVVGLVYARGKKWPVLKLCDFFAPILPLAQAIGRLGCFFNGCCYGKITDASWGVVFSGDSVPRIPVQLVELAALGSISAALFFLSRIKRPVGELFVNYLILYSAARFLVEFLRGDQELFFFLTLPQWTSFFLFIGGLTLLFLVERKNPVKK